MATRKRPTPREVVLAFFFATLIVILFIGLPPYGQTTSGNRDHATDERHLEVSMSGLEINGWKIRAEKKGQWHFSNERVDFADGSYCDLKTGKIVNKGPGKISMTRSDNTPSNDGGLL